MVNTYTKRSPNYFSVTTAFIEVVVGSQEEDQQTREVEGKACQEGNQEAGSQEGDRTCLEVRKAWEVVLAKGDPSEASFPFRVQQAYPVQDQRVARSSYPHPPLGVGPQR